MPEFEFIPTLSLILALIVSLTLALVARSDKVTILTVLGITFAIFYFLLHWVII